MKRALLCAGIVAVSGGLAASLFSDANAQPGRRPPVPSPTASAGPIGTTPSAVRAHVGTDYASRLLRSSDHEDRIRGIRRLATIGNAEAVALLVSTAEVNQTIRADSRATLELARALARFADQERARSALLVLVNVGNPRGDGRLPAVPRTSGDPLEEGDPVARMQLAREVAAIALAGSGVDKAHEQLYGVVRAGGSGRDAAMLAIGLHPPRDPAFYGTSAATISPPVLRMLGQLGDLRAIDVLSSAVKSTDVLARCAALVALAELGDERAITLARAAIAEPDARLRAAAGEAFVLLGAGERWKAVSALIADEATTAIGIRLAERVHNTEITQLLAARAHESPDRQMRMDAIVALGRSPEPTAAQALVSPKVLADPVLQYHAMLALARSPATNAMELVSAVAAGNLKTLGVRAYVVRALVRNERNARAEGVIDALLASNDPASRAVAVYARVALDRDKPNAWLDDKDARVRRAAAMATLGRRNDATDRLLLMRMRKETDDATRQVLALGLLSGDPDGLVTTSALVDRAEAGGADAALSAFALVRRAEESQSRKVEKLLVSRDPVLRSHAALGLATSPLADATGRLADAYAYETDASVRRAIVGALAARAQDATAPQRKTTLELAARLDPDGPTRTGARRATNGVTVPFGAPASREVAWLKVTVEGGGAPKGGQPYLGALVGGGIAVPLAFDDEGYVLVAGLPPGEARLVLAPRLPVVEASKP